MQNVLVFNLDISGLIFKIQKNFINPNILPDDMFTLYCDNDISVETWDPYGFNRSAIFHQACSLFYYRGCVSFLQTKFLSFFPKFNLLQKSLKDSKITN